MGKLFQNKGEQQATQCRGPGSGPGPPFSPPFFLSLLLFVFFFVIVNVIGTFGEVWIRLIDWRVFLNNLKLRVFNHCSVVKTQQVLVLRGSQGSFQGKSTSVLGLVHKWLIKIKAECVCIYRKTGKCCKMFKMRRD